MCKHEDFKRGFSNELNLGLREQINLVSDPYNPVTLRSNFTQQYNVMIYT